MNENPEGTPNPLNPNVGPVPTPEPLSANPSEPLEPAPAQPAETAPAAPETPTAPETTVMPTSVLEEKPVEAPAGSVVEAKPKKKTGLIAGIIIAIVAVIGIGVGVAFAMGLFGKNDPVAAAVTKIISGEIPENLSASGTLKITPLEDSEIESVQLDINASAKTNSLANMTTADLTLSLTEYGNIELTISEIYAAGEDLYLKIENIDEMLSDLDSARTASLKDVTGVISLVGGLIDGEWIRISAEDLKGMIGGDPEDGSASCLADVINLASGSRKSIAEIYSRNAFISASDDEVKIAQKANPIYKIAFDEEKKAAFYAEVEALDVFENAKSCVEDMSGTGSVEESEIISNTPTIYVEINDEKNITRLYTKLTNSEETYEIEIDLSFSYPTTINISEPDEYMNLNDLIMQLFMGTSMDYDYDYDYGYDYDYDIDDDFEVESY